MPGLQALAGVPSFTGELGRALGGGLSQGISTGLSELLKEKQINRREKELLSRGLPPHLARLGAVATVGGQTEIFKYALDEFKRSQDPALQALQELQGMEAQQQQQPQIQTEEAQQQEPQEIQKEAVPEKSTLDLKKQALISDIGLTPAERVARQKERYTTNLPIYQETTTKIKDLDKSSDLINILENLEKTKKLPANLGRANVDKEGNLRFPFLSTPEAERFQKTLNEFSVGAKDTFGARVTNFDLAQFMKRYPTLLNSEAGRKQILQQMKIVNEINKTYYSSLKKAYDQSGGIRKVDADEAERRAEEISSPKINELKKKFDEIGQFPTLPNASEFKGKKIRNNETGEVMISDGINWIPEKK